MVIGDWLAPPPSPRRASESVTTPHEQWGLLTGHQRRPPPGHQWGLFHGHGQQDSAPLARPSVTRALHPKGATTALTAAMTGRALGWNTSRQATLTHSAAVPDAPSNGPACLSGDTILASAEAVPARVSQRSPSVGNLPCSGAARPRESWVSASSPIEREGALRARASDRRDRTWALDL